jgi:hypothetical protein
MKAKRVYESLCVFVCQEGKKEAYSRRCVPIVLQWCYNGVTMVLLW